MRIYEITVVCFGVKYFKYMFRVRGPPMAQMLARLVELWVAAPARSNFVSKRGFPEASSVAIITGRLFVHRGSCRASAVNIIIVAA